jgi:hypothetical protein
MKAPPLANKYDSLTAEERFRLILAASGRGDKTERDRLKNAGAQITLSMADHSPYAHAFDEVAMLIYIELLNEAASYKEFLCSPNDACNDSDDEGTEDEDAAPEDTKAKSDDSLEQEDPDFIRTLDLALAIGYLLQTKANGWKLFCERLNVPPFLHWEILPGFDRLQHTLAIAEKAAFVPEGFLRWLNRRRPKGMPELTTVPITAEGIATEIAEAYRQRARWWGA